MFVLRPGSLKRSSAARFLDQPGWVPCSEQSSLFLRSLSSSQGYRVRRAEPCRFFLIVSPHNSSHGGRDGLMARRTWQLQVEAMDEFTPSSKTVGRSQGRKTERSKGMSRLRDQCDV